MCMHMFALGPIHIFGFRLCLFKFLTLFPLMNILCDITLLNRGNESGLECLITSKVLMSYSDE